jgi:hypothetical protein
VSHRGSAATEIALRPAVGARDDRHRTIAHHRDAHRRAEAAALDLQAAAAERATEGVVEALSAVGRRGLREVGTASVAEVAIEGELRDGEHRSGDVRDRARELAAVVVEDAQRRDLRGEALPVFGSIVRADAEEDDETAVDRRDALARDLDVRRDDALDDRANPYVSSSQGLSPRTTASTSSAVRCPGAQTVMFFVSGRRVTYVTLPKR